MAPSVDTAAALAIGTLMAPLGFLLGAATYAMSMNIEDRLHSSPLDRVLGKLAFSVVGALLGLLLPLAVWKLYQLGVHWL